MKHQLLIEIKKLVESALERDEFLFETAGTIKRHFPRYNWVGFYFLKDGKLHVGPYVGEPTPHTVIDPNKGICGAAVSQQKTIIVDDVNADPRYLACSLETRSEIVVPIRVGGEIIGELDIDSNKIADFNQNDKQLLEEIAGLIGERLENQ
jgi:L-methionine (R)-S-oxide reductase